MSARMENDHKVKNDHMVRATAFEGTVRALAASTTKIADSAKELHGLMPVATAALGRTLTAGVLMSGLLTGAKDSVTIQIKGDGPLGGIVAAADSHANVRGYVCNPLVDLPVNERGKLDVAAAVGKKGYLNVIRDMGLKEPYIGYVNIVSGEIAEDIAYYYASSEQIPSIVALGVLVDRDGSVLGSGGFIVQLLPGAGDDVINAVEQSAGRLPGVSALISEGLDAEDILYRILGRDNCRILEKAPCSYRCNCSRERMERSLISLGGKEISDMIEEQHGAELECHFCNSRYRFSEEDLRALMR